MRVSILHGFAVGAALFCLATAALAQSVPAENGTTFIHAGRLLADPATGRVEQNRTVVVRDRHVIDIKEGFVGTGRVIDLRDSFVLPGLIDSHVHVSHENGPNDKLRRTVQTAAALAVDGAYYSKFILDAGFTTVVDVGAENDAIFALRDSIAAGKLAGPRILAAGNVISPHGGEGDLYGYRWDVIRTLQRPNLCSGADDCRRVVRQQIQRGADLIKIVATGAVLSDAAQGLGQQFTDDELKAIVETAHGLGRWVAAHAHAAAGVNAALRAGVDSIEHGSFLDDESIRLFKARGAYLVPTMLASRTVREWALDPNGFLSPQARQKALRASEIFVGSMTRAHAAGVKIAFGTDSGVSRHGVNGREFALLTSIGLTPLQAVQSATVVAAAHIGMGEKIGSLQPGKAADVIAVKGDPLADVTELERVTFVMKGGVIYKQ